MIKNISGTLSNDTVSGNKLNYRKKSIVVEYETSDDSEHVAYTLNPSTFFKISNNYIIFLNISVSACRRESAACAEYFRIYTYIKQDTNNVTKKTAVDISTREDNTAWNFTTSANTTDQTIEFLVQGTRPSGYTNIMWILFIDAKMIRIYPGYGI